MNRQIDDEISVVLVHVCLLILIMYLNRKTERLQA